MVSSNSPSESSVSDHYTIGDIMDRIKKGLTDSGKDLGLLKVDDLAPCDAFHSRGRVATTELTDLIEDYLTSSTKVLDVGCGLGGTSRHLADKYGCRVTGIDLTEEYVQVGNELNKMVGIDDRVNLLRGNALDLPFNDKTFDLVWTEHVQMNIADKAKFYAEISRVLKPSGCFLFHDVFRGPNKDEPVYPAPWAEMAELSCLENDDKIKQIIANSGLEIQEWIDKVAESVAAFEKVVSKMAQTGPPPLGIHLLMGETAYSKIQNYVLNMKEQRLVVALGIAKKQH